MYNKVYTSPRHTEAYLPHTRCLVTNGPKPKQANVSLRMAHICSFEKYIYVHLKSTYVFI